MSPGLLQTILLVLTCIALLVLLGVIVYQRIAIRTARRGREDIDREEHRVFDFIHGLGETLVANAAPREMYKAIGTGARGVLECGGSTLYIWERKKNELAPKYLSPGCTPLIPLPDHVTKDKKNKKAIGSYTRLVPVPRGSGTIGKAFAFKKPRNIADLASEEDLTSPCQRGVPAMIAPLTYGDTDLGVLIATAKKGEPPFNAHAFELFRSVAEQSAFALGNALAHQQAAEKHRIDKEIKAASEIQQILLPSEAPEIPGYSLAGENVPASIVSGDYYDFIEIDEHHLGIAIADVSGKGIPASLVTAMCRATLRLCARENRSPAEVVSTMNRHLFPDLREDMFITLAYLVLDIRTGDITLARAGHDPPYHFVAATGELREIRPKGMGIGLDAGPVFDRVTEEANFRLEDGDALFLFTDGINEALDKNGDEFGLPALETIISSTATTGAEGLINAVLAGVHQHVGFHPQSDDITLIALEKR